jgi:hypothetical protein
LLDKLVVRQATRDKTVAVNDGSFLIRRADGKNEHIHAARGAMCCPTNMSPELANCDANVESSESSFSTLATIH